MADIETLTDEERAWLGLLRKVAADVQAAALDKLLRIIDAQAEALAAAAGPCYARWQTAEAQVRELTASTALLERERDEARRGWKDCSALSVAAESDLAQLRERVAQATIYLEAIASVGSALKALEALRG